MTTVNCTVKNCVYWAEGDKCAAEEITIKTSTNDQEAQTLLETVCETFKRKED